MAELPLAIAGVILAWKGIVDFGEFIKSLTDNVADSREGLWLKLEVSQFRLKEWGGDWGVDRADGAFHQFEPARKKLILKIMSRLRESRLKAVERLRNRYGLSHDDDQHPSDEATPSKDRLGRFMHGVKAASRRVTQKSSWLTHDKTTISSLVIETDEMHEHLQYLTYGSRAFIQQALPRIRSATSLEAGLSSLMHEGETSSSIFYGSLSSSPTLPTPNDGQSFDNKTLASFSTKKLASNRQVCYMQQHIESSFDFHGDICIPETVPEWWNSEYSELLLIEAPDIAEDHTAVATCALVYYLTSCHRIVYSVPRGIEQTPAAQFLSKLKTLPFSVISLRGSVADQSQPLPLSITEIQSMTYSTQDLQSLVDVFSDLMQELVSR